MNKTKKNNFQSREVELSTHDSNKKVKENLPKIRLEDTGVFLESTVEHTFQEKIKIHKNNVVTWITFIILGALLLLTLNRDYEKDYLMKEIYKNSKIEMTEKVELINQIRSKFNDDTTNLFVPTFTLTIGYFLGSRNQ